MAFHVYVVIALNDGQNNCLQRSAKHTFYYNKMQKLTNRQVIMISDMQANSLVVLKSYKVNVSQFIRQAIKEKLQREWQGIKQKEERIADAPDWLYD